MAENICEEFCVAIGKVPNVLPKENLLKCIEKLSSTSVEKWTTIEGAENDRNYERLLVKLNSKPGVKRLYEDLRHEEIEHEGENYTIVFEKCIGCEIPLDWEDEDVEMDGDPDPAEIPPRSQSSRSQDSGLDVPNQSGASPHPSHFSQMTSEIGGGTFYQNVPNPGQDFTHAHQGFNTPGQGQAQQPIPQMFPFPIQMFQPYQQPGDGQNLQQQLQQQIDPRAFQEFLQQFQMQQGQPYGQAFPGQSEGTNPTDPPPPYTSGGEQMMAGSITELKGPIGGGQAVADQEEGFRRLNEKAEREKQTRNENYPKNDGNDDEDDGCQNSKCQTTKLVVKDLPTSVQEDLIELYFEKLGKDEVVRIEMDEDQRMALVEFKEPEAVKRVLNSIPVQIRNTELRVRPFYEEKEEEVALCTVEVHGLNGIDASTVEMYFEFTKRSGGDDIGEIDYDEEEGRAFITYKSEEIARRVADKGNHILSKQPLEVTLWQPPPKKSWNVSTPEPEPEPEFEPADTIEVRGIDESIDKEILEMYFESKKHSGGDDIQRIEIQGTAVYITYTSEEVAQRVVDKRNHYLNRLRLDVTLFRQLKQPGRSRERSVTPEPVRTIEVLGIDESIDEARLEMYFENTKRSGGGEIETVDADYEEGIAYITFAKEEVAERVISKERHILNKKPLQVQLSAQTSMCEEIVPPEPLCTVEVQGITPSIDQETLEMYFENSKRSGGGDISNVDIDKDEGIAHITFNEEEVAKKVADREHVIEGTQLEVSLHIPPKPRPYYEDKVLIRGLKSTTTKDCLFNFLKAKSGSVPLELLRGEKEGVVLITFESQPDVSKLVEVCNRYPLEGGKLEVSKVQVTNCIIVLHLPENVTKDTVWFYFENKRRSDGGPIDKVLLKEDECTCLVYFEDYKVVDRVIRKTHKIGEQVLTVNVYLECLGCPQGDDTEKTKETSTTLKLIETKMLLAEKYPNKMESKYPGLKVKINQNKNEIVFDGLLGDIKNAKLDMFNYKENFAIGSVEMENCRLKFSLYENKPVKDYIVKKLKSSQVTAVWQVKDQTLQVCCGEAEKLGKAVTIVKESIVEHNVTLSKENVVVVESESWESMLHEQNQKYPGRIAVDTSGKMAYVCGTDDIADEVLEVLKKFLRTNTIIEGHVDFTKTMNRLIEKNHKQDIERISKKDASLNTKIVTKANNAGFTLLGTAEGVEQVKKEMNSLKPKIITKTHTLESPGIADHMESKGHEHMNTVEKSYAVVFDSPEGGDSDRGFKNVGGVKDTDGSCSNEETDSGTDENAGYKLLSVKVEKGDITKVKCDCIVNSSNDSLDLSTGAVSQALMKIGGQELKAECKAKVHAMKADQIVMTKAPGFPFKYIIHVVAQESAKSWKKMADRCFLMAEGHKIKSIAFPALGTNIHGNPAEIANMLVGALREFEAKQHFYLREVQFVIYKSEMVDIFKKALENTNKPKKGFLSTMYAGLTGSFGRNTEQPKKPKKTRKKTKHKQEVERPDQYPIRVHSMSQTAIDDAIKRLEDLIKNEIYSQVFKDPLLKNLNEIQRKQLKTLEKEFNVQINFKGSDSLELSGMIKNMMDASNKIHSVIRDLDRYEHQAYEAKRLTQLVQWFFIEIFENKIELLPYIPTVNTLIENAYNDQKPTVAFSDSEGKKYIVDFAKMHEYPEGDPDDSVNVIRRDNLKQRAFNMPDYWNDMGSENFKVVTLQNTDQEFQDIAKQFRTSVGSTNFEVTRVDRIQNKILWTQYHAKKKLLDDTNESSKNESMLWHGTAVDIVDSINANGFNRSYCGKNATAFGDGVYFAVNASYSCSDTYSRPDSTGTKRMYLCQVLTGEFTLGKLGMRVPPPKQGSSSSLYDSVVDNVSSPTMYIIFSDAQAYPQYLILFKKK